MLICKGITHKIKSCKDKFLGSCYWMILRNIHKLRQVLIFLSITGLIIRFFPSILSVLPLDYFNEFMCKLYLDPKRIIFGDPIMTSGLPDELDETVIKDDEVHEAYDRNIYSPENKEKMIRNINSVGNVIKKTGDVSATVLTGISVVNFTSGKISAAKIAGAGAVGSIVAGEVGSIIVDNVARAVKNIPDYHPVDEAISPSAYDLEYRNTNNNIADDLSNEEPLDLIESDTESGNIINSLTDNEISKNTIIPPIDGILEYFEGLDDAYKLVIYSVILIIIVIYIQLIKVYKNKINTGINNLPINNKYFGYFIQYKNFMNRFLNIYINYFTWFFLFIALLGLFTSIILV